MKVQEFAMQELVGNLEVAQVWTEISKRLDREMVEAVLAGNKDKAERLGKELARATQKVKSARAMMVWAAKLV